MSSGEAAHPAVHCNISGYLGKQMPTVLVSHSDVGVIVEGLSVRPVQSFCRLLALPQEDLPAQGSRPLTWFTGRQ